MNLLKADFKFLYTVKQHLDYAKIRALRFIIRIGIIIMETKLSERQSMITFIIIQFLITFSSYKIIFKI